MNEIRYNQVSSTFGQVLIAGLFATQILPSVSQTELSSAQISNKRSLSSIYRAHKNTSSYSYFGNPLTGEYNHIPENFERAVSNFYLQLLTHQEQLGEEFEQVLYQNLWDLYES